MEEIKCRICGRTKEGLRKNETMGILEYGEGGEAHICSVCRGVIEKIAESIVVSHLSGDLDSHQELSDFIKSIVESYLYPESEERF